MKRWVHSLGRLAAAAVVAAGLGGCYSPPSHGRIRAAPVGSGDPSKAGLQMGAPWTGWDDAREPSIRFTRADMFRAAEGDAWAVEASVFSRGRPGGRWTWSARRESELTATPPVVLPGPFDSIELWAGWETAEPGRPAESARVSLIARDADGFLLTIGDEVIRARRIVNANRHNEPDMRLRLFSSAFAANFAFGSRADSGR